MIVSDNVSYNCPIVISAVSVHLATGFYGVEHPLANDLLKCIENGLNVHYSAGVKTP